MKRRYCMNFNKHYALEGKHAFLSASKYSWVRYDSTKVKAAYLNAQAQEHGTRLHKLASDMIKNNVKAAKSKKTFNSFVNDAIGYRMESEQILYYSPVCFGTADAIMFDEKTRMLRIFDLKTGITPAHVEQLMIYAALFCLEYNYNPESIDFDLRIYQSDEIIHTDCSAEDIRDIMNKIRDFSEILEKMGDNI